jgi:hypothetical protein
MCTDFNNETHSLNNYVKEDIYLVALHPREVPDSITFRQVACPEEFRIFSFTLSVSALEPTQPIQWVSGALCLGIKRPGFEADHSPPSSGEVKNARSYTPTPQYVFMAWCLVKYRDNFTFSFTYQMNIKASEV